MTRNHLIEFTLAQLKFHFYFSSLSMETVEKYSFYLFYYHYNRHNWIDLEYKPFLAQYFIFGGGGSGHTIDSACLRIFCVFVWSGNVQISQKIHFDFCSQINSIFKLDKTTLQQFTDTA